MRKIYLRKLIENLSVRHVRGDREVEISGLAYDSRAVKPGYLFVALRGNSADGHDFIKDAVQHGARAVVAEEFQDMDAGVAMVQVLDSHDALSKLAVVFYKRPFREMSLIGITGTNGKTTTSYLLESILLTSGANPGVIGTVNYRYAGQTMGASVTTPESLDLMRILRKMADAGVSDVVMEVSSHALDQGRAKDCPFRIGIFTNISRDHLDYHRSMEEYFEAKSLLFRGLGKIGNADLTRAIINADDPKGQDLARMTDARVWTYGMGSGCDVRAEAVQTTRRGLSAKLITPAGAIPIRSPLIGSFNIYNIMAAAAAALCLGIDPNAVALGIAGLKGVPGRLESVENKRLLDILVDYAHTPDALRNAIAAVRPIVNGRLITVFGCGGDRDMGKRRDMGHVAGKLSDVVFITSDNPRSENPASIASEIEKGVRESGLKKLRTSTDHKVQGPGYIVDLDRGNAIRSAVRIADDGDLILIAGKGHEDYQIIGDKKRYFDDRKVALDAVSGKTG